MSLPQELTNLLNLDGFVFFIEGNKGKGKTNFALLIAQICYTYKYRVHIASNIKTESYMMEYINNYPDLENWLKAKNGKKLYILDESGKHIAKMAFMSGQNKNFMNILQLIRHYDGGFIGIAPSTKRVDSGLLNTDILDAKITKITLTTAKIVDYFNNCCYFLNDLPRTSILHSSKDLAVFSMERKVEIEKLSDCCQLAHYYYQYGSIRKAMTALGMNKEQVEVGKRLLIKHLRHTDKSLVTNSVEVRSTVETE